MSIETVIEKSLKKSDKRTYLQISLIFGIVFALLNGGTIVNIATFKKKTNLLGVAGAVTVIYFLVQAVALGLAATYNKNLEDIKASSELLQNYKNMLKSLDKTLSELNQNDPCFSLTGNFPTDQTTGFVTENDLNASNANCSPSQTIDISEDLCPNMTGCNLSNCSGGRCSVTIDSLTIPIDECELPTCDPSACDAQIGTCTIPWGQSCDNICDPNRYPKLEEKRKELLAKIKTEDKNLQGLESLKTWFPPIAKAANYMTPIMTVGLLVMFFIAASRIVPSNVPNYWEAGWVAVIALAAFIASSMSIYVLASEL